MANKRDWLTKVGWQKVLANKKDFYAFNERDRVRVAVANQRFGKQQGLANKRN